MNPQHTIPTMKDGDFCLNESRPTAIYLISKYGKDDKLYPKDVTTRAIIDQRLYFDMGVFYKAYGDIIVSNFIVGKLDLCSNNLLHHFQKYPMFYGKPAPGKDKMDKFNEVMGWVEDFIKPTGYVAGTDHMTVADIAWVATFR